MLLESSVICVTFIEKKNMGIQEKDYFYYYYYSIERQLFK